MRRDRNRPEGIHERIVSRVRGVRVGGLEEAMEEIDDLVYVTSNQFDSVISSVYNDKQKRTRLYRLQKKKGTEKDVPQDIKNFALRASEGFVKVPFKLGTNSFAPGLNTSDASNIAQAALQVVKKWGDTVLFNPTIPVNVRVLFDRQIEEIVRKSFITENEKEILHKYILAAKEELAKDYIKYVEKKERNTVNEYNLYLQDKLYDKSRELEKIIPEQINTIYNNSLKTIPALNIFNALGLKDDVKGFLKNNLANPNSMLTDIGRLGISKRNEEIEEALYEDILTIINKNNKISSTQPASFVKEKPSTFNINIAKVKEAVKRTLKNKFAPIIDKVFDINDKVDSKLRDVNGLADKLARGTSDSFVRRNVIKDALLSFEDNIDFYSRNKRALNEDAALLIDKLFSKDSGKKNYTEDRYGTKDKHFDVLCRLAEKFNCLPKTKINQIKKDVHTRHQPFTDLPLGTWRREKLRRSIEAGRHFHLVFDEYAEDKRLTFAAEKRYGKLNLQRYFFKDGIPQPFFDTVYSKGVSSSENYLERIKKSKERYKTSPSYYKPMYNNTWESSEHRHVAHINYIVHDRLTEDKLRKLNPRFLRSLFNKNFTPSDKQAKQFKELLFGTEDIPYDITERELLESSVWRMQGYYKKKQLEYKEAARKIKRHDLFGSMKQVFGGLIKPFAPTKEYTEKQSFILLPDGSISMNRLDGHGIFTIHPDGSTTEDTGITSRIGYAAGSYTKNEALPYDPFFNPIGFKEGSDEDVIWRKDLTDYQRKKLAQKEEEKTYSMQKGSAIHKIVETYYKSGGKIIFDGPMAREHEVVQKALVTIDTLNKRYPKNKGWEIRVEQLIPGFGNLEGFKTPIDVLAYNKWTGKVEILDLKTGHLDDLYVQLQLSTEAYMLEQYANTGFLKGIKPGIKAKDVGLFSLNTKVEPIKPWGDKYTADIKQHDLYKLSAINKIFSKDMWIEEKPGFLRRINPKEIDIDAIKNAAIAYSSPLFNAALPERFGFKQAASNYIYAPKRAITFDLETTKTNKSKNEVQSLSALSFMLDPLRNKFYFTEASEGFFLTKGKPDELEPSELIHGLTNKGVVEINKLRGQMESAALSMDGILNFMKAIQGNVIIGHNIVEYDFSVLYSEFKRLSREKHTRKGIVRTDLVERDKRKFAKLFSTLTIIDTLTLYRALDYDSRGVYDYSDPNSLKNVDIFKKKTGWSPREGELHGSTIDSFMSSVIGEAAIHGDRETPKQVTALLRYLFSGNAGNVTIMHGTPLKLNAESNVKATNIPFSLVQTDVRILNPNPEIDRIKVVHASGVEYEETPYTDSYDTRYFVPSDNLSEEEQEKKEEEFWGEYGGLQEFEHRKVEIAHMRDVQIKKGILPKLWDPTIKKAYLADEAFNELQRQVNELKDIGDDEGAMLLQWLTVAEFTKIRDKIDPVVAGKFMYKMIKGKSRKLVELLLNNPFNEEAINTLTRSTFDVNDYITTHQLALGFIGEGEEGYLLIGKPLAFMLSQYYNNPKDIKEKYTMTSVGTGENNADGAQLVNLSGESLSKLKDIITSSIFSEYGGLLDKTGLLSQRVEGLSDASRRATLGTLAAKAAITDNPQALKTFEAVAGVLLSGSENASEDMKLFNQAIAYQKQKFDDPKYKRDVLYKTMSKAGFSNGSIADVLSDKSFIKSFNAEDYTRITDRAEKLGLARSYARDVLGLDISEKHLTALMMGSSNLDNLYNPEFLKDVLHAQEAYDDKRLALIADLQKKYGLSDGEVAPLKHKATTKTPLSEFQESLSEVAEMAKKASDRLKLVTGALNGISGVPFYDPENLLNAGYRQVSGIHGSLKGLIPSSLNNVVTKFLAGNIQEYEYGWQKPKYAIQLSKPLLPIIGSAIGGALGGPTGAMLGGQTGIGMAGWITQLIGTKYERSINEMGLFFSSRFNKMGAFLTPAIYALNLFTKALKIASVPLLAGIGAGIYQYRKALNNMNEVDTPLYNLTGISYGNGYNALSRADYMLGMRRGATNSIIEGIEFAKQGLFTLGKYDKNKMISAAMLGIFNEAFIPNSLGGAGNYAKMMDTLLNAYKNTNNPQRFMYLLNEYNPEMAKQLQARTDMDAFFATQRGKRYSEREIYYNDITYDQSNEFKAIRGIQASFGESIKNSFMKIASGLYNWKGFDFMNKYVGVLGSAANAFVDENQGPDVALKILGQGINDFLVSIKDTWTEIQEKLNIKGLGETLIDESKRIWLTLKSHLVDFADKLLSFVEWVIPKLEKPIKGLFTMLYEQFKKLFDFVGNIHMDIDWKELQKGNFGAALKFRYGDKPLETRLDYNNSYGVNPSSPFDYRDGVVIKDTHLMTTDDEMSLYGDTKRQLHRAFLTDRMLSNDGLNIDIFGKGLTEKEAAGYAELKYIYELVREKSGKRFFTDESLRETLSTINPDSLLSYQGKVVRAAQAALGLSYIEPEKGSRHLDNAIDNAIDFVQTHGVGDYVGSLLTSGHSYLHEIKLQIEKDGELLKEETFRDKVTPTLPRAPVHSMLEYTYEPVK